MIFYVVETVDVEVVAVPFEVLSLEVHWPEIWVSFILG